MTMLSHAFGRFVAQARFEHLPLDAVEAVKMRTLDLLGAALGAYRMERHEPLSSLLGAGGPATAWGNGAPVSIRDATLFNTFLAHALYQEDGSRYTGGHPASVVIPGALAFAEAEHISGGELVIAIAAGYEVFLRLGRAIYPSLLDRGFQSTAVLAAMSCAASGARVTRLDATEAGHAIAIAASLGVGLKASGRCSASQPLQVAHSAHGGAMAVLLAKLGLPGAAGIVEKGFLPAFAADHDASAAQDALGTEFLIGETYLKLHGGCRGNHAPIDAFASLIEAHVLQPESIASIDVWIDTATHEGEVPDPATGEQAQYSVAFALAARLVFGDASVFRHSDENVREPRIRALMGRVAIHVDPELDRNFPTERGARVRIRLQDGRELDARRPNAIGEPEFPVTRAQIEQKFRALAGPVLPDNGESVIDCVRRLDELADVNELTGLLHAVRPAPAGTPLQSPTSFRNSNT